MSKRVRWRNRLLTYALSLSSTNDSDAWKKETFKPYNFNTLGLAVGGGHLHPLMKVRAEFRRVLMDMGCVLRSRCWCSC